MHEILTFIHEHPWLSVFIMLVVLQACANLLQKLGKFLLVWKHGWPVEGSVVEDDEEDEDEDEDEQEQSTAIPKWAKILGVSPAESMESITKTYRKLAMKHHPDKGGDTVRFQNINWAFREAKAAKQAA